MERGAEKLELAPPRIMCGCGPALKIKYIVVFKTKIRMLSR